MLSLNFGLRKFIMQSGYTTASQIPIMYYLILSYSIVIYFILSVRLFSNFHVLVCPIYVLEPKIQKYGVKIPKWDPSIWQGVNVGFILIQSTLVVLILNPMIWWISTQSHMIYDDSITTIHRNEELDYTEKWVKLSIS